jgi:16S rRNA (adenine(1408)-N(1))-methyltransferase
VTIDVGTGDGRAVLAIAALDATTLALGLDASAAAMVEASRRAARAQRKGGRPNAAFLVATAEAPPTELERRANVVTVRFPWGSLLRGCVGTDAVVAHGVAGLVAAGGTLELLLAPSARDGLEGVPTEPAALIAGVAATFAPLGFHLDLARVATETELAATSSTWARRLGSQRPGDRTVMLIRLVRSLGVEPRMGGSDHGFVARE